MLNGSPATFKNNFKENSFKQSSIPSLHGIVKPDQWAELSGWFALQWIMKPFESKVLDNKLFVIITILQTNMRSKNKTHSLAVIKLCPGCFATAAQFWDTRLETQYWTGNLNPSLLALPEGYPSAAETLEVALVRPENNIVFDHFMMNIGECTNVPSTRLFELSITDSVADKSGKQLAAIWHSIFKNYTYN